MMPKPALVCLALAFAAATASCSLPDAIEDMKRLRYEAAGPAKTSAEYCGTCHEHIYAQWSQRSRHAKATASPMLHHVLNEISDSAVLSAFLDGSVCYSCHGDANVNEGVNCQACHGAVLPGVPIEKTHELKFTPRLATMRRKTFCARCHQAINPISGEYVSATYHEWQHSPAAAKGQTCQNCHMAVRGDDDHAYHGFDTAVRNPGLYRGDVTIGAVAFNPPELSLTIHNRVQGHSIPAGGTARILALKVRLLNEEGRVIHSQVQTFSRRFSLLPFVGVMPFRMVEDTKLSAGERRRVSFSIPAGLADRVRAVSAELRLHEVAEEHHGDIGKAHWSSGAIATRYVRF